MMVKGCPHIIVTGHVDDRDKSSTIKELHRSLLLLLLLLLPSLLIISLLHVLP